MFENYNEWQKTEQVPILIPRATRNFPNAKTRNKKKFDNWTLEIIPFIQYPIPMDWTEKSKTFGENVCFL